MGMVATKGRRTPTAFPSLISAHRRHVENREADDEQGEADKLAESVQMIAHDNLPIGSALPLRDEITISILSIALIALACVLISA